MNCRCSGEQRAVQRAIFHPHGQHNVDLPGTSKNIDAEEKQAVVVVVAVHKNKRGPGEKLKLSQTRYMIKKTPLIYVISFATSDNSNSWRYGSKLLVGTRSQGESRAKHD